MHIFLASERIRKKLHKPNSISGKKLFCESSSDWSVTLCEIWALMCPRAKAISRIEYYVTEITCDWIFSRTEYDFITSRSFPWDVLKYWAILTILKAQRKQSELLFWFGMRIAPSCWLSESRHWVQTGKLFSESVVRKMCTKKGFSMGLKWASFSRCFWWAGHKSQIMLWKIVPEKLEKVTASDKSLFRSEVSWSSRLPQVEVFSKIFL